MENQFDISGVRLSWGAHDARSEGVCLLEAVAWFAGEDHSDEPSCVSPVLAAVGRKLNDRLLESDGQLEYEPRLRALIPRLVGTAGRPDLDDKAGLMAEDFLVRRVLPVLFRRTDAQDLCDYADKFEAMPEITNWGQVPTEDLRAAYDAARAAAWTVSWNVARVTYGYAVRVACTAGLYEEVVSLYERMIDIYHEED